MSLNKQWLKRKVAQYFIINITIVNWFPVPEVLGPGLVEGAMCGPNVRLLGGKCEEGLKCVDVGEYYGICKKEEGKKKTEDTKGKKSYHTR